MSKSDFELLMFTIYLERMICSNPSDMNAYSDYKLSKQLAVTQSRISSMKVRSGLKYPSNIIDWKEVFQRCARNAKREGSFILIYIPDRNVYLEVKNAIEMNGGFSETTLTQNLLKVEIENYVDLMLQIRNTDDREEIIEEIKSELKKQDADLELFNKKTISEVMKEMGEKLSDGLIDEMLPICFLKEPAKILAKNIAAAVVRKMKGTRQKTV